MYCCIVGIPDVPLDVQVEAGPQEGTLLISWYTVCWVPWFIVYCCIVGIPDAPLDVQVEAGPREGSLLITWLHCLMGYPGYLCIVVL